MKKKMLTILLAMSMAVGLAACGSASGSSDSTTSSEESSDTESAETAKSSDDSKSDASSKSVPSEVTEDNIADFPVTDESEFTLETGSQVSLSSLNLSGWEYKEDIPSDECAITSYTGTDKVVVIPEEINGKKVAYLSSNAFFNNKDIEGVYVPDTVKAIGEGCFFYDDNLKVVRLSENLEKSFLNSFKSLDEITLPASYNYMPDNIDTPALKLFAGVKTVYLEKGISDDFANWLETNSTVDGQECFKVVRK